MRRISLKIWLEKLIKCILKLNYRVQFILKLLVIEFVFTFAVSRDLS